MMIGFWPELQVFFSISGPKKNKTLQTDSCGLWAKINKFIYRQPTKKSDKLLNLGGEYQFMVYIENR